MIVKTGTVTVYEDGSVDVRGFIFKAPSPTAAAEAVKWAIEKLQSELWSQYQITDCVIDLGVGGGTYTPELAPAATRPAACPPAACRRIAESSTRDMTTIRYGDGLVQTQQGVSEDGFKCLALSPRATAAPVGGVPTEWDRTRPESEIAALLEFKTLESARVLQDELNELVAIWSREIAPVVIGK